MKYTIIYSPESLDDLRSIYSYIRFELLSPQAAENTVGTIRKEIRKLDVFPESHRQVEWEPWASMGMRIMQVKNYVVYYLIDKNTAIVSIVRVFYGGRDVERIIQEEYE